MEEIKVRADGGYIGANASTDPDYPGINAEFVTDNYNGETLSIQRDMLNKIMCV